MLDLKLLREEIDTVKQALAHRGADIDLDAILALDEKRRRIVHESEQLRAQQNAATQEIAKLKKAKEDASEAITAMQDLSKRIKAMEEDVRQADQDLHSALLQLPNLPHADVPQGRDESDNRIERTWGEKPTLDFEPKDHVDIGEALGILDFERAAKLAGARFCLSRGQGARLERALISLMLDTHTTEHGYTEILPPFLVNSESMTGTGQLPKFGADSFRLKGHDLWLVPTAEVPVTNIHRGEILTAAQLPVNFTAYTPCFRSEAGSYGKDTRGMIRQHQFNKVELVKLVAPEDSAQALEELTSHAEAILQKLDLHYRVVTLCTGDLGFSATKTYDLEVWLPSQNTYREISSCSNFGDFQARRASIRFKRDKKPEFVHTLNGSGLAVGRTVVAILENYQQEDGSVRIPDALQPYMGGATLIQAQ